jgi:hypothetical protein
MSDGQLAMNTNLASPGLFLKDSNGDLVKVGPVHVGATAPNVTPGAGGQAGNSVGEAWFDTAGTNALLKIWDGTNWEAGGVEQLNVIYVDTVNGDDTKDGHRPATAKKTIKSAVTSASAGNIIRVAAGVYQEILPIDITVANLSIVGDSVRSVFVHPTAATETGTMFRCNSGTYIAGFTFCGLKASGTRGANSLDTDPVYGLPENQGWAVGFYPGCILRKSPWIENCSHFADSGIDNNNFDPNNYQGTAGDTTSAPTGGGVLVDGSLPHVTSPLRSVTVNEFTQVCLDGPGLLVCNNGYAQAVSFFGLFCHYHAKALSGGQINMEVGTTNFGRYGVIADGKSTSAIFTATANGAATTSDVTFAINAPTAAGTWFGDATRPAINMLVQVGGNIYPILSASANGAGWNVTISRPDPLDRSINLGLLNGHSNAAAVSFFLRSMVSTASHTMEYAGSGTDYTALPENGGVPNATNEAVSRNDGRVWLTSTDQSGKFKVGDTFEVNQETGYVTIDPTAIATNIVSDGTPQLGGDLDVLTRKIYTSQTNNSVVIDANGTGSVQLKTGGTTRLDIAPAQIGAGFLGTASVPAYSFTADPDTGLLSTGANALALSTGGTSRLTIDSSGNVAIPGALTQTGNVTLNAQADLRFADADSSNWVAFQGPATIAADVTWTLPAADGTNGQVLSTNGTGTLSWATGGGGGGATDKIEEGNSSAEVIDTGSDGRFVVTTEGSERLRVNSAGEIGIAGANYGTSGQVLTSGGTGAAPTWSTPAGGTKIEVGNTKAEITDTGSNGTFAVTTEGTQRLSVTTTAVSSTLAVDHPLGAVGTPSITFTGDLNTGIYSPAADTIAFVEGGAEAARIDSSGRLLVGTSSSVTSFQVQVEGTTESNSALSLRRNNAGNLGPAFGFYKSRGTATGSFTIVLAGDSLGQLYFYGADGTQDVAAATITAAVDGTPGANDMPGRLVFSTTADGASSATERMRINSTGDVMIACTTRPSSGNVTGVFIEPGIITIGSTTSAGQDRMRFETPSGRVGTISTSGSATAYNTSSDYRLKENVTKVTDGIARLQQLKPSRFNFIADRDKTVDGFIAHEAQAVVPECVTGEKDAVDADGNPVYQGIDQSKLVPLLTAALQEAIAKIEDLEGRLTAAGL